VYIAWRTVAYSVGTWSTHTIIWPRRLSRFQYTCIGGNLWLTSQLVLSYRMTVGCVACVGLVSEQASQVSSQRASLVRTSLSAADVGRHDDWHDGARRPAAVPRRHHPRPRHAGPVRRHPGVSLPRHRHRHDPDRHRVGRRHVGVSAAAETAAPGFRLLPRPVDVITATPTRRLHLALSTALLTHPSPYDQLLVG